MVSALFSESKGLGSSPGPGTALCSWARHFTLTDGASCVYHSVQGVVEIFLVPSC